jgi:hypothetical protein
MSTPDREVCFPCGHSEAMSSVTQRVVDMHGRRVVSCAQCNITVCMPVSAIVPGEEPAAAIEDRGLMLIMEIACIQKLVARLTASELVAICQSNRTPPEDVAAALETLAQKILELGKSA